jgi:hypothetical protein
MIRTLLYLAVYVFGPALAWAQDAPPPYAPIRFMDVTAAAGLERIGGVSGVSFADFNGDGWDDLTFAAVDGQVRLWANQQDGTFRDVTPAGGLPGGGLRAFVIWFDHDADAFPDLLVGGTKTALYRNLGSAAGQGPTFADVTAAAGLSMTGPMATGAVADVDGDGWLDVFLTAPQGPDRLYMADGTGAYREEAALRGVLDASGSFPMQAVFVDVDGDGDQDLYALYDGQQRSRLFMNNGSGMFTESAVSYGLSEIGPGNTMGLSVGDLNEDGIPDFHVTRIGRAGLFVSHAGATGPTWSDQAMAWGAGRNGMSWGTVLADADADGDLDLAVVNTSGFDGTPSLFFERTGPATYSEQGTSAGFAALSESYGLAWGDINQDGLPDFIVPDMNGRHRLLENVTGTPGQRLAVVLDGPPGNRTGVGARIRAEADGHAWIRWQLAGDSYLSQQSRRLLFGVGTGVPEVAIEVTWPDGEQSTAAATWSGGDLFAVVRLAHSRSVTVESPRAAAGRLREDPSAVNAPGIQVWPNPVPSNGILRVMPSPATARAESLHPTRNVFLYDALGRLIWQGRPGNVDLSRLDLAPGVHVLRYFAHFGVSSRILVVTSPL